MSEAVLVLWDDVMTSYDFGPSHPLRPLRLDLTIAMAREAGVLDRPNVIVRAPEQAADDLLELVHDTDYIAAVKREESHPWGRHGLGTPDNPVFERMHESSALVSGASVGAAQAVWSGAQQHAVNLAGGLHHAMRDRASGFCIYDDPALAIAWLLSAGAQRVAYVDIDVHHGDGVQTAFYADPRVLTISVHESGRTLFPGTGWADEIGVGDAVGTSVNVPLPSGTGDDEWLAAFHAVVPPLLRSFRPEVLVTQHGCDTHLLDPLAHLRLSVDGQRSSYAALHSLAHEVCAGRWVALGGGGYDAVRVVPRAWTHLLAEVVGVSLDGPVPPAWRERAVGLREGPVPESMLDGGAPDPARPRLRPAVVEPVVAEVRRRIFPLHALDPEDPSS